MFINKLIKAGELRVIDKPVSPNLEITEIADRISKRENGGEALLFNNTGTTFPVLINAYGSQKRMEIVFKNQQAEQISAEIFKLFQSMTGPSSGFISQIMKIPQLKKIASWMPKKKKGRGICQEVLMEQADLSKLPVLTCWPADGGPFITLPMVHTTDPQTGIRNVGMYRLQVLSKNTTGMHWHMHKTGARHYREYKKKGAIMPVAVALGGDPVYAYSATAPLPDGIDEYMLAGFLRRKSVELVKCLTQDIWVPADADIILEGYVDPNEELTLEGPFGDHTGYYSLADQYPVFHVTAITHRKNATYPTTIVGIPPQEDAWFAKATEEMFMDPIRLSMIPELQSLHLPEPGVAHNIGFFSVEIDYPGQGRKALNTVWGAGQMMFTKFGFVFDRLKDLRNYSELAKVVSDRVNPLHDLIFLSGPLDILDHASEKLAYGGKLGIDATGQKAIMIEPDPDILTDEIQMLRSANPCIKQIQVDLLEAGISLAALSFDKTDPDQVKYLAKEIAHSKHLSRIRFWIFTDADLPDKSWYEVAWIAGSHVDPSRDCQVMHAFDIEEQGILFLDASRKTKLIDGFSRDWPNPVVMDLDTIKMVDENWPQYQIGDFMTSPSNRYISMMNGSGAVADE